MKSFSKKIRHYNLILIVIVSMLLPNNVHAATITVNTCDEISLKTAISNAAPGDTIAFACSGTIMLTSTLILDKDLTLDGNGQNIILSGNGATRVVYIPPGPIISLKKLIITDGYFMGNGGAGIYNKSNLTVIECIISKNQSNHVGGGIFNELAILNVVNSTIANNTGFSGGGIYNNGSLSVTGSTFTNNIANDEGGGIASDPAFGNSHALISNSTFYKNEALFSGGGIDVDAEVSISNSTFSENKAPNGGGIHLSGGSGKLNLINTIIANSQTSNDIYNFNGVIVNNQNNLIENPDHSLGMVNGVNGNIIGINPNLGQLQDNSGPTQTMAITTASAAYNAGDNIICEGTDQRGISRPQGVACDIGAYESQAFPEIDVQRPGGTTIGDGDTDDIGYQAPGTVALAYTIDNTAGTADLTIPAGGVTASNFTNSSNFSVSTSLPLTIAAGDTETLNISFEIDALGSFQFDLDIENDDDDENPYDIRVAGNGGMLINEVDADTPGTDAAEFIELYDGGSGNISLNGLVLVFHNGSGDKSYRSFDLDGYTTDADGYFVLCGDTANVANCDDDVSPNTNLLQNGADAVALYMGDSADFPNDTPVTTTNLLDALVYDTYDADDAGLLTLLNSGQTQINENTGGNAEIQSNQRCPNGSGGQRNTNTYGQYTPTPGEANCPPDIDVQRPASASIADGGTDAQGTKKSSEQVTLTYTIENKGDSTLNISNITAANETNVSTGTITPTNLTIVAGDTATFDVPYTPNAGSGTFSFDLDITNNDPDEGNYDIIVSGTRDGDAPSVTIEQGSTQADPTHTSPIIFDVEFSESVTGFDETDLNISGMAATPTIAVTGSGTSYTVEVSGMADGETITASIPANAAQDSAGNDNEASTSTDNSVTYDTAAVTVTIDQGAAQPDPTHTSPIIFDVEFSESVTGFDEIDLNISGMAATPTVAVTGSGTSYTVEVSGMADGETITASIPANAAQDAAGNDNEASTSTDNSVTYDETAPTVLYGANTMPAMNAIIAELSEIQIEFSENITRLSAEDQNNYLLVEAGVNGIFDTLSCASGTLGDDFAIPVNTATYDHADPFLTILDINNGISLPIGVYRLFICGTTSIEDLAGIHLNNGVDSQLDFQISPSTLPSTGFRHGQVTSLPNQPAAKAYTDSAMTLEIPSLGVTMPIVGVPQTENGWDVTWLGNSAGYLAGSAFPTWAGNTVITGHVWDAYNRPGVFAEIKSLGYGDQVQIRAWGATYTYEVRESKLITKKNINAAFQSEAYDWLTLVTCEFYNPFSGDYLFRRAVRAVLVSVK